MRSFPVHTSFMLLNISSSLLTLLKKLTKKTFVIISWPLITIRNSSRKVMFSQASVKNSIHYGGGRGVCLQVQRGVHPLGRHPPQADTPWAHTPPSRQTPAQETASAADGTHPTGIHSCISNLNTNNKNVCPEQYGSRDQQMRVLLMVYHLVTFFACCFYK